MPYSVYGFTLTMALFTTGNALVLSSTVMTGEQLATNPSHATLPLVAQYIGLALATLPMAHFMAKFSRRMGFLLGTVAGLLGAILAVIGIYQGHFILFTLGIFGTGLAIGTAQQYRFAALEEAPPAKHSQAITWVISGGVVAALFGPRLAVMSKDIWAQWPFLGTFSALVIIYILALILWCLLPIKPLIKTASSIPARSYQKLYSQKPLKLIAICTSIAYGLVVFSIGALPFAIKEAHLSFANLAWIMQWHILAMFAPSLLMGKLLDKIGIRAMFILGCVILVMSLIIPFIGRQLEHFTVAMTLLGLSWNILFLASTRLLPQTYQNHEKAKTQGMTDLLIFASGAVASLLSAKVFLSLGLTSFNIIALIASIFLCLFILIYRQNLPAVTNKK